MHAACAEGEFIETLEIGLDEAVTWVREGRITEVKTIIGLMWVDKLIRGEWPQAPR